MPIEKEDFVSLGELRAKFALAGVSVSASSVRETGSTNSDLIAEIRAGAVRTPRVLAAEKQTAGRGTHGRTWKNAGESLLFSFAFPCETLEFAREVPLLCGYGTAKVLRRSGVRAFVKWTNDIWLEDGKIGGILCETAKTPDGTLWVVCGIGLNLVPGENRELSGDYRSAAVSEEIGVPDAAVLRSGLLSGICLEIWNGFRKMEARGLGPDWSEESALDILKGKRVTLSNDAGLEISGFCKGTAPDGSLMIETCGEIRKFCSGTVRFTGS